MAVTRINNNQISDASAGNIYLGVNAAAKLQNYSITSQKIANNLTYNSDFTVSGNLTVNGQTTTIDTVSTVIEDPVILLASNQTGSPSVDIGFIGERGSSDNIAFVWDESADEFVTAFTSDTTTNTTITISSYANFHTNDANIGGNIVINGTTSYVGNIITPANFTGNVAAGNISTNGVVVALSNITGANLNTSGKVVATGNVETGANLVASGFAQITGNVTGANINTGGIVNATGNINSGANLVVSGYANVTGNVNGGNVNTTDLNVTGNVISDLDVTGNIAGQNISTPGTIVASGNISTGGNVLVTANINIAGNINASIINTNDLFLVDNVISNLKVSGNITGQNIFTPGLAQVTGNVTGGNLITSNLTQTGTLQTTGNAVIGGNLIVQGNITYINIDDLRVEDPIIILGTGPNGAPLTTNDGKDRGVFMEYYTTGLGNAFMGWDNSSGNMVIATSASMANDVVTINEFGTLQAGNLSIQSAVSSGNITGTGVVMSGNVTGGNLLTAGLVNATGNVNGGNVNTTNLNLSGNVISPLNVTGNITSGNLATTGQATVTGNVTGGNIITTGNVNSNQGYFTGNVTVVGTFTSTSNIVANTSGVFYGNAVTGNDALYAGLPTFTPLASNVVAQFTGNANSYSQINFENISAGNAASTDYVATANNGDDSTYYINMGITSNTHTGIHDDFFSEIGTENTGYLITVANDATGPGSSGVGNLMLGSTNGNVLTSVGNTSLANIRTVVSTDGFDVTDGGNLYTSNITSRTGRVTVNNGSGDVDFAVNGDTRANVLYIDAGTGTASFGSATQTTGAIVAFNDPGSILMPVGNTAQRPTGVIGMLRFNSTNDNLEVYDAGGWSQVGVPVFTVIADEQFNGDGSTVAFTLGSSQTTASCIVSINGVIQVPTIAYSVSGTTLTFTEAPQTGDLIDVRQITTTTTVTTISNTPGTAVLAPNPTLAQTDITGNLIPTSNVAFNLGSPTNQWNDLYLSGNSIYIGDVILKAGSGNLQVRNFDDTADAGITGTFYTTSTTAGNLQIGFNHIEATNLNGNIDLRPNGTGKVTVSTRLQIGNVQVADAGSNTVVFYRADGTTPATISNQNIDTTQIANGTSSLSVIASGGNIRANVGGATIISITSTGIVNGQANGVGNIGSASTYFDTVFAKATSAQYADLAEKYTADAEYAPGTVVCFGGSKEVTVTSADADRKVAGVVSTNPSYVMNAGLESEYVATVALTGRVPCRVTGTVRKGDMMVSAGYGLARAEENPRIGTVIGKALEDHDGGEGVIEVVVGRF